MLAPMRLQRLDVHGYRVLGNVALEPRGLNVLIGANGAGKSTVLDLFVLLTEAMRGGLAKAISIRGGISRILTLEHADHLALRVMTSPVPWPGSSALSALEYLLEISPSGVGYSITKELLQQDRGHVSGNPFFFLQRRLGHVKFHDPKTGGLADPDWPFLIEEAALGQVPRTYAEPEALRSLIATSLHAAPIALDERSPLRLPQTLQPPEGPPSASGSDLVSVLYQMRSADDDLWQQLMDLLGAAFPRFRRLEFPLVAGGQAALAWYERDVSSALYANELSTGTLRFLHLGALLLSRRLPGLVLLDEPELSLHPEALRLLSELLVQASAQAQIFVATRSAALVRWMRPGDVLVAERDEGGGRLVRGDSMDLEHWLDTYTLDQLWQMGVMGGKP
ncbi:MAG: AAA family ATPase [Candidatus Latescibacterota bacterium]